MLAFAFAVDGVQVESRHGTFFILMQTVNGPCALLAVAVSAPPTDFFISEM